MTYEEAIAWLKFRKDYDGELNQEHDDNATTLAIEALEKQIPKKPKRSGKYGVCPSCSRLIERYEQKHGNIEIPHCKWCGKKLDWSEVE